MKIGAVIVCAGSGRRLGKKDKAFLKLGRKPLLGHSFKIFKNIRPIKQIVLVLKKKHFLIAKKFIKNKKVVLAKGGRQRKDSVYNGLLALAEDINYVLIHDGARPLVKKKIILNILKALKKYPAVICGLKSPDTVKIVSKGWVKKTIRRDNIFLIQTPQGFKKDLLFKAFKKFPKSAVTDEAQLLELMGKKVRVVEGDPSNIKITYLQDLALARAMIR